MVDTLADHLRTLPDDDLAAVLRLRPDLVVPPPADMTALAARAQARVSVSRALDALDQFTLEILDALRLCQDGNGSTSTEDVLALTSATAPPPEARDVRGAVDRLRSLLIVYGQPPVLQIAAGVDEVCSPYPAGLGAPAVALGREAAALCADAAKLRRTVLSAPPNARAVLDRLAAGPPRGAVSAAMSPESPVRWLLDHDLLAQISDTTVEMPREVGLLLRRDKGPLGALHPQPPASVAPVRDVKAADSAGAGQAMEAVRRTEALLDTLAAEPAPVLRAGGLSARDLRRLCRSSGLSEPVVALLLEVAWAAGLLAESASSASGARSGSPAAAGEARFLPAAGYDAWRAESIATRWIRLARAWLATSRQPSLVGQRDERDKLLAALSPDIDRTGAPYQRASALGVLADAPPGMALGADDVLATLAWRTPRRFPTGSPRAQAVGWALEEAAHLGVSGLGAITSYGRLVLAEATAPALDGDLDPLGVSHAASARAALASEAVAALDTLLPAPVDHVLLQADLTVVVPGPPEPGLGAELAMIAEPESAGGATVYRITPESVRRALDAGYTAEDLHRMLTRRSRTPAPQGLTYLIDDVARRHGGLRAGTAGAYLRSDDEPLLAELLADRRLAALQLRRLAPTVLVTPFLPGRMLSALREAGYAPVPEDPSGATVLTRPRPRRGPARPPVTDTAGVTVEEAAARLPAPRLAGIIEQIRRGDVASRAARAPAALRSAAGDRTAQAHNDAMAVLAQAVRDKQLVWVGYVDAHGENATRLVRPVSLGSGYLRAEDDRSETLHTFALHRITAAVLDQDG